MKNARNHEVARRGNTSYTQL